MFNIFKKQRKTGCVNIENLQLLLDEKDIFIERLKDENKELNNIIDKLLEKIKTENSPYKTKTKKQYMQEYYQKNKEKIKAYNNTYWHKNKERIRSTRIKQKL